MRARKTRRSRWSPSTPTARRSTTPTCTSRAFRSSSADMRVKSGETVARIPLDQIDPDFRRAELRFEGIRPPVPSFEVRVFVDEQQANARTPTEGNSHYLGTQYFYGTGVRAGW